MLHIIRQERKNATVCPAHTELSQIFNEFPSAFDVVPKKTKIQVADQLLRVVEGELRECVSNHEKKPTLLPALLKVATVFAGTDARRPATIAALQSQVALLEALIEMPPLDNQATKFEALMGNSKGFAKFATRLSACERGSENGRMKELLVAANTLKTTLSKLASTASKKRLETAVAALENLGQGGEDGASWKSSLAKGAQLNEVQKHATGITNPAFAAKLKKNFADANQDELGVAAL